MVLLISIAFRRKTRVEGLEGLATHPTFEDTKITVAMAEPKLTELNLEHSPNPTPLDKNNDKCMGRTFVAD